MFAKQLIIVLLQNLPRYVEESDFQLMEAPKEKDRPNYSTQTIHELFSPPEQEEGPAPTISPPMAEQISSYYNIKG